MSAARHTPGPWAFEQHPEGSEWLGNIIGNYGPNERGIKQIRTITCQTRYGEEAERLANAHLIAAAPCMAGYIAKRAAAGDAEAIELLERINGTA